MSIEFFVIFAVVQIGVSVYSIIKVGIKNSQTKTSESVQHFIEMMSDDYLNKITTLVTGIAVIVSVFYAVVYVTLAFSVTSLWIWTALGLFVAVTWLVSIIEVFNQPIDMRKNPPPTSLFTRGLTVARCGAAIVFLIHWLATVPFGGMR